MRTMRSRAVAIAAGALLAALPACHAYVPISSADIASAQEVRLELTDAGTAAVAPWVGPRVASVAGRVVGEREGVVTLALTGTTKLNGVEEPWRGEQVEVRLDQVRSTSERRFSGRRTAIAGGAFALLGTITYAIVGRAGGGSGGGPGSGGPPR